AGNGPAARTISGAGDPMRWFVLKGAKNREAAEQLIRYLIDPTTMRQLFEISPGYVYPGYQWGWDDKFFKENQYAAHVTDGYRTYFNDKAGYINGAWPGPPTAWTASLESQNFWTEMFGD